MAEDKVKFTVEGKGKNLKKTAKEAKAVGDGAEHAQQGLDKASKSGDKFHKSQKGVAGVSSNSTKNFSKMRGAIGGGASGLGGAYATLAANVFAATAAFNQLRPAAQMEIMVQGLEAVGAAAGRNLPFAAQSLREISGEALSAEASVRVMSLGISAGFRTDQMERLTTVARGASLALGRDMTDALDRLTRGTAKLEPEILDELGIMVRLDDAALKYATTLGKSVDDLTQYERRQAFLNETLEQGEKKFGQLAESIDVNPYDQLSASLNDLAKAFLSAVNKVLVPTIDVLTENSKALTGVIILFGTSIFRHALPAVTAMAGLMGRSAAATKEENKERVKSLKTGKGLPKVYNDQAKEMRKHGLTQERFTTGLRSLNQSLAQHKAQQAAMAQTSAAEITAYNTKTASIARVSAAKKELIATYMAKQLAQSRSLAADALELLAQGNLIKGTKALTASIAVQSATYMAAAAGGGIFAKSLAVVKVAMMGLWRIASGLFTLLLGPWGIALIAASVAVWAFWDEIKTFFGMGTKQIVRDSDAAVEALEQIGQTGQAFSKALNAAGGEMTASVMVAGYRALNGVIQETQSHLKKLDKTASDNHTKRVREMEDEIAKERALFELRKKEGNWADKISMEGSLLQMLFGFDADSAEKELNVLENQLLAFKDNFEARLKEDQIRILETMIAETRNTGAFGKFAEQEIKAIEELKKNFNEGLIDKDALDDGIEKIRAPLANLQDAFDNAQDALANFNKETNKLATKTTTPFDKAITAAQVLSLQIEQVRESTGKLGDLTDEQSQRLIDEIKRQTGAKSLGELDMKAYVRSLEEAQEALVVSKENVKKLKSEQKRLNDIAKGFPKTYEMSIKLQEKQEQIRKQELTGLQKELFLTDELAGKQLKVLQTAIEDAEGKEAVRLAEKAFNDEKEKHEKRVADLKVAILTKIREEVSEEEKIVNAKIANLDHEQKLLAAKNNIIHANKKLLELDVQRQRLLVQRQNLEDKQRIRITGGADLSPGQEYALAVKTRDVKLEAISQGLEAAIGEQELAQKRMELELESSNIKLRTQIELDKAAGKETEAFERLMEINQQLFNLQIEASKAKVNAAKIEAEMARSTLGVEEERFRIAARQAVLSGAKSGSTTGARVASIGMGMRDLAKGNLAKQRKELSKFYQQNAHDEINAMQDGWGDKRSFAEKEQAWLLANNVASLEEFGNKSAEQAYTMSMAMNNVWKDFDLADKFNVITDAMQPMIDGFKELGNVGVAVGNGIQQTSMFMGGMTGSMSLLGDALKEGGMTEFKQLFTGVGETASTAGEKIQGVAAVTGMAASAVGGLFSLQKMAADVAVARIDNEIAAEKKRDGKSAASLAKLKQLEDKKEKMKKKAFEADKKAKMAGIVMSTAMGIMQAFAQLGVFGPAAAAMIGAMGAAQLAIASSMTYGGGAGGGAPAPAQKISVGSRSNKVDVAGSKPAGELAYLRGERGIGSSASDFSRRGAFVGAKYRAVGGAAYVVGEQGPEVIVPETPGRIIPNDELTAGGQPINATFNIQTIDATNMEETLISQRGNIINMIREAANNQGETFLENLDTMALGDSY